MVEHATVNRVVEGSSPSSGANYQAVFYGVIMAHTLQTKGCLGSSVGRAVDS